MGYPASGPIGDGWYVRVTSYREGTYTYLGPFMSRQGMVETAAYLTAHAWHRPADYNVQQYTRLGGVEDIPGLSTTRASEARP